jgi:PKD repeat protein
MSNSLRSRKFYFGSIFISITLFHAAPVSIASDELSLTSDTVSPLIVSVYAEDITSYSVVINWTTDEHSDTQVEYGISQLYGNASDMDSSMVTDHRQMLTGLSPSTQYHYRVWSQDADGNLSISDDHVFNTASSSDPPHIPMNQPPVISFLNVVPSSGTAPLSVIFWVGASDPDGKVIEYDWDFDGNGSVDAVTTSNRISFIYNHEGVYAARVRIFDDEGASTISAPVTIKAIKTGVKQEAVNNHPVSFLRKPSFSCTGG